MPDAASQRKPAKTTSVAGEPPELTRARRRAIRVLAVLGLLAFSLSVMIVLQEVADPLADEANLQRPGSREALMGAEHPNETVHVAGAVAALLLGGSGLGGLVVRPRRLGSGHHAVAAAVGTIVVVAIVGDPDNVGGMAGPIDLVFLILAVPGLAAGVLASPLRTWRLREITRPQFLVLAVAGAPFLWYGTDQAFIQRYTWPPLADPHHQAHWYMAAVLAFMIVFVAASAALSGTGWRIAAVAAAAGALTVGVASLADSESASAVAWPWALLAIGWGLAALALARSDRPRTAVRVITDGAG